MCGVQWRTESCFGEKKHSRESASVSMCVRDIKKQSENERMFVCVCVREREREVPPESRDAENG